MIVSLDAVIADSRCQSRTGIDLALVQEYADHLREGAELPPLSTIRTDAGYVLYDGFHRLKAYRLAGSKQVEIVTDDGDVWDAIERSCRVNTTHGKRRTPADTKRAVETILTVMRHRGEKWSNVAIAEKCALSPKHVGRLVNDPSMTLVIDTDTPTTVTRNGTTYEMDTAKIGRWRAPTLEAHPEIDEETGEILDDEPEVVGEEVDPNDIASYQWEPLKRLAADPPKRTFDPQPAHDNPIPDEMTRELVQNTADCLVQLLADGPDCPPEWAAQLIMQRVDEDAGHIHYVDPLVRWIVAVSQECDRMVDDAEEAG